MAKRFTVLFFLLQTALAMGAQDIMKMASDGYNYPAFKKELDSLQSGEVNSIRDLEGKTLLHWAAARSHQCGVTLLLLAGADANVRDNAGRTPIFGAVNSPEEDAFMILEMLAVTHADVNAKADDGTTPLAAAALAGNTRAAEFLLWLGAQVTRADAPPNKQPLAIAYSKKDARMIALLEAAAKLPALPPKAAENRLSNSLTRRFSDATRAADLNAVEDLLASGMDINQQDEEKGATALFRAVNEHRADLVTLLLLEGANPNLATKTGRTPLFASMRWLDLTGQRMMLLLLVAGADAKATTKDGYSVLSEAVFNRNNFGAEWMIWRGADLRIRTPRGSLMQIAVHIGDWPSMVELLKNAGLPEEENASLISPVERMFLATKRGDIAAVERELANGVAADATCETEGQRVVLEYAAMYGRFDIVDLLLKHGANINRHHKNDGSNMMHALAAWGPAQGDAKVAASHLEKLIARGADPNIAMKDGTTPLMAAAKEGVTGPNTEVLLKAGAQINARNKDGLTALGVARKFGRTEMIEFLKARGAVD